MSSNTKIAFIHTVPFLAELFQAAALEAGVPADEIIHLIDPGLFSPGKPVAQDSEELVSALANRISALADMGARGVLMTCSALGNAIEIAAKRCAIPVIRIDHPLAMAAIEAGERIAVLSTHPEGLEDTMQIVRDRAASQGRKVEVQPCCCDGAFDKLAAGDPEGHDQEVARSISELLKQNDIVVLAQPSIARVLKIMPPAERARVLTSIEPGVHALKRLVAA
ncbi:aspartate/glutamate racemase family protein [Sphingobium naphthae]|nr:aspartate/glutamate racemase family protein [Sphingobium naphthae]